MPKKYFVIGLASLSLSALAMFSLASQREIRQYEHPKLRLKTSLSQRPKLKTFKPTPKNRKIETRLNHYLSRKLARKGSKSDLSISQAGEEQKMVRTILETTNDTSLISKKVKRYGARILKDRGDWVAVEIPADRIEEMATDIADIKRVRFPFKFFPFGVTSEGIHLTGADHFHHTGFTGAGVKIAVMDVGFKGLLEAHSNGDIPYGAKTHDFTGKGLQSEYFHGTACAEIVHDMAPNAELHLLKVSDEIDIYNAIDYCIENDVDIISLSIGTFGTGPGDGTGPLDEAFDDARANGILVVASAGNMANSSMYEIPYGAHWKGTFYDSDDDDIHEFIQGDSESFYNAVIAVPSQDDDGNPDTSEVSIVMRWNDWPYASVDYDMYLHDYFTGELVGYSNAVQDGSQPPIEAIGVDLPDSENYIHYYALLVTKVPGEPAGKELELFLGGTSIFVPFYKYSSPIATSSSSMGEPADAESVFAVGAIDYMNWETGPQEDFSSQGPTNAWAGSSARIKPDICGPDGTSGYTYGVSSFFGTSAAAPHVAGAAALILSMNPTLSPDELQSFIETNAMDMGADGKDNLYGWGRMNMRFSGFPIVKSHQKISDTEGNFTGILDNDDGFGYSLTSMGDLDGDGVTDLAVGAIQDEDGGGVRGAVWILFLNLDRTVKSHQKISDTEGNFTGVLDNQDFFGEAVASTGDLDGDGVTDLAVGADGDDDGGSSRGAVWILFLNTEGTVKSYQKISNTEGNFAGILDNDNDFGNSVTSIGDLDGDGVTDLAVGAYGDDDGGVDRGAVWILFLNTDGTVKSYQKISDAEGNFAGLLDDLDWFGQSVTSMGGDLDGDGVTDLAVGATGDDDGGSFRGAVWILFLNTDGTIKSHQKISDTEGNFAGNLDNQDYFGQSVTSMGDLDGDGVTDLAVGATGDEDGGDMRGAVWVLFLNTNGTVKSHQKISDTEGDFTGIVDDDDYFGQSLTSIGDLDGDGVTDLAVGAHGDDDGGSRRGAVWILFLNPFIADKDGDGMDDHWEIAHGLNPDLDDGSDDPDNDGYSNLMEFLAGTDPKDADSDDDGISDGDEDANHNQMIDAGETSATMADTDGDGIQDGTERGVTAPVPDPDGAGPLLGTDTGIFIPDADPTTTTDPRDADVDDDGLKDGEEDINHNGRFDEGESDPHYNPLSVDAGPDQTVTEGTTVTLDGSNSYDLEDGNVSFLWRQMSGPWTTLSDSAIAKPTFVTPPVDSSGTELTFQLTVRNNSGCHVSDEIVVRIDDNGISGFPDDVITTTSSTNRNIGIKMEIGGDCVSLSIVSASTITSTSNRPENLTYGLFDTRIKTDIVGGTVTLTFYLPSPAPDDYTWFKYSATNGWTDFSANAAFNDARDQVTLTLTDGGVGDDDGVANRLIVDPSGLGSPPAGDSSGNGGGDGGGHGCFIATLSHDSE